jgi:isopentenyl phosphate kinase
MIVVFQILDIKSNYLPGIVHAGGSFGKNLMQYLIEQEIKEVEDQTGAQVIDM